MIDELTLPGSQSGHGGSGNDPYQGQGNIGWQSNYHVGGETYILVETNEPCSVPTPTPAPTPGASIPQPDLTACSGAMAGFRAGVACGLQLIRDTLRNAGVEVGDDPPVPGMLFSIVSLPPSPGIAWQWVSAPATHGGGPLSASLVVSHTIISGTFQAEWATDAWVAAQFTTLSIPQAQVYDANNTLIAEGAVQARPVASPPLPAGEGPGAYAST